MDSKVCTKCGVSKPLTEFHNLKASKDGKSYYCRACVNPGGLQRAAVRRQKYKETAAYLDFTIYLITNTVNGKQYVGQTKQELRLRWNLHCTKRSGTPAVGRAIKKYGRDAFAIRVLSICHTAEQLDDAERYFIDHYGTLAPGGYNLNTGGNPAAALRGVARDPAIGRKISKALTGKKLSPERVERIRAMHTGTKRTQEQKDRMSKAGMGRVKSPETIAKTLATVRLRERHWRSGVPSVNSRKVKNSLTGEIYSSIAAAARAIGVSESHLWGQLHGKKPNTTPLCFL